MNFRDETLSVSRLGALLGQAVRGDTERAYRFLLEQIREFRPLGLNGCDLGVGEGDELVPNLTELHISRLLLVICRAPVTAPVNFSTARAVWFLYLVILVSLNGL